MATKGFDRASVNEVAKAAGLTQGLVHYDFKNKLGILLAALDEFMVRHLGGLDHIRGVSLQD